MYIFQYCSSYVFHPSTLLHYLHIFLRVTVSTTSCCGYFGAPYRPLRLPGGKGGFKWRTNLSYGLLFQFVA